MRHTGAGLAIPDFPLMFGHLVPDHWDAKIAIHFAHRVGALVVALASSPTAAHVWYHHRGPAGADAARRRCSLALVAVQVTLGALTVLSRRDVWINSVHVVCGALVLADVAGDHAAELARRGSRAATRRPALPRRGHWRRRRRPERAAAADAGARA